MTALSTRQSILLAGAHRLTELGDPFRPHRVSSLCEQTPPGIDPHCDRWIAAKGLGDAAEACLRQTLLAELAVNEIMPPVLAAAAGNAPDEVCALPRAWRDVLRAQGVRIDEGQIPICLRHICRP